MAVQPGIMPKLGAYTEDVLLTEWLVAEGAQVEPGAVVFELETDTNIRRTAPAVSRTNHTLDLYLFSAMSRVDWPARFWRLFIGANLDVVERRPPNIK